MKKLLTFLFVATISFNGISQSLFQTELQGELVDPKRDQVNTNYIGQISNGYVTTLNKNGSFLLEIRDSEFKVSATKEVNEIVSFESKLTTANFAILKNKLFILYSNFDKSNKETTTYIQQVNTSDLSAIGSSEKLATQKAPETDNKMTMSVNGFGHEAIMKEARQLMLFTTLGIVYSPDKSKALFCSSGSWNDKTNPDMLSIIVIDENGQLVWENNALKLTVLSTDFDVSKIKMNNNGDIFISGMEYVNKTTKKAGLNFDFYHHLICVTEKGKEIKDFTLNEKVGFIYSFDFNFDTKNNVKIAGIYSSAGRDYIDGIFTGEVDANTGSLKFIEKNEVRFNFTEYGKSKKSDSGLELNKKTKNVDFAIDQIYVHPDGSYTMVAEKLIYMDDHLLNNMKFSYVVNLAIDLKDIIIARIDKDGKVVWNKLIPKNHSSMSPIGDATMYGITEKNKEIYIVRNENPENEGKTASEFENLVPSQEMNTMITHVNSEGEIRDEVFLKSLDKDLKCLQIKSTDSNIILLTYMYRSKSNFDDKKYKLSLLKF